MHQSVAEKGSLSEGSFSDCSVINQMKSAANVPEAGKETFYVSQTPTQHIWNTDGIGFSRNSNLIYDSPPSLCTEIDKRIPWLAKQSPDSKIEITQSSPGCPQAFSSGEIKTSACAFQSNNEYLKSIGSSSNQNSLQMYGGEINFTQQNQISIFFPQQSYNLHHHAQCVQTPSYETPFTPQPSVCSDKSANMASSTTNNFLNSNITDLVINQDYANACCDKSIEKNGSQIFEHCKYSKSANSLCQAEKRKHKNGTKAARGRSKKPRLCHFLLELLDKPDLYSNIIVWIDRKDGVFKFVNSSAVASQWGRRRDKPNMKYENFARSLRTYISKGFMAKPPTRLVYKFTSKAFSHSQ